MINIIVVECVDSNNIVAEWWNGLTAMDRELIMFNAYSTQILGGNKNVTRTN